MSTQVRPTGVTILAVLEIISGIISVVAGAVLGTVVGMMGMGMTGNEYGALMGILGGFVMALGIISFVMAWGLLKGKSWAWTITLVLTIISLITNLPSLNIIGLIINGVILYYLFRPHVKAYFGKGSQTL